MSNESHSAAGSPVPAEFIAERKAGWHMFTRFTVVNCVAVIVLLFLMLVFLRIL